MIRSLQLRVNKRTKDFDLSRDRKEETLSEEMRQQVERIAGKQAHVEELTRTMAEKMNREED